jgi:hypothetical protein
MLRIILTVAVLLAASCQASDAKPSAQSVAAPSPETMAVAAPTAFDQKMSRLTGRTVEGRTVYSYCDVFGCIACPPGSPCPPVQTASIIHCCNHDGICVHVQLMGSCDPDFYVVICDWGQINADGTITCYE